MIMAKQALDEAEFDEIDDKKKQLKKRDYSVDEGDRSNVLDQTDNPMKNSFKTGKGSSTTKKDYTMEGDP